MYIKIGKNKFDMNQDVKWDTLHAINGHWMIIGSSGVGKTYRLIDIVRQVCNLRNITIHIFDSHGNIYTYPDKTSEFKFGESSNYRINPLKISSDPDYGGVRRRINSFTAMVNRYSAKLGIKQEMLLKSLLYDLYSANGIYQDNQSSWHTEKKPILVDLKRFTYSKLKYMIVGASTNALKALDDLSRKVQTMQRKVKKTRGQVKDNEDIEKLKMQCKEKYGAFIDHIETGR